MTRRTRPFYGGDPYAPGGRLHWIAEVRAKKEYRRGRITHAHAETLVDYTRRTVRQVASICVRANLKNAAAALDDVADQWDQIAQRAAV